MAKLKALVNCGAGQEGEDEHQHDQSGDRWKRADVAASEPGDVVVEGALEGLVGRWLLLGGGGHASVSFVIGSPPVSRPVVISPTTWLLVTSAAFTWATSSPR